jgi:integrase
MPALTDTRLRNLKAKDERYLVWDRNGLGVRVGTTGKKSFVYAYREGNRVRWVTLGTYPALSLVDARLKHAEALKAKGEGRSPADALLDARQQSRDAPTVAWLADYYIERYAKRQKKSWAEDERLLKKDVILRIGRLKAREVKRRDIIELIEDIADRGAPVTANRTLAVLTRMFNFAVERDLLTATPCAGIKRVHREQSRERVLSESELRALCSNLPQAEMTDGVRLAIYLMLVTGQRRSEVVEAPWAEFDLAARWWTIPASRTKNGRAHRVPLTRTAMVLLRQVKKLSGDSPYLFPSPVTEPKGEASTKARPLTVRAITRAVNRNLGLLGAGQFTPHDLRRTVASHMASLGVPRLVISKVLNHVEGDITAVYDRHSYDWEKRQALKKWANKLRKLRRG